MNEAVRFQNCQWHAMCAKEGKSLAYDKDNVSASRKSIARRSSVSPRSADSCHAWDLSLDFMCAKRALMSATWIQWLTQLDKWEIFSATKLNGCLRASLSMQQITFRQYDRFNHQLRALYSWNKTASARFNHPPFPSLPLFYLPSPAPSPVIHLRMIGCNWCFVFCRVAGLFIQFHLEEEWYHDALRQA